MTRPDRAHERAPSLDDLIEAARLLGCDLDAGARPATGRPGAMLTMAAVALGAAEVQVANAESGILRLGGSAEDAKSAADVTALVTTTGDPWFCRRWLMWHAGRLIHQLHMAERRGALPPDTGSAAAHCVFAVHQLLVELADADANHAELSGVSAQAVAQARHELHAALDALAELAADADGRP